MWDEWPGKCPKCGRFCGKIVGYRNEECLTRVEGVCKKCGKQDLSKQPWAWEDFFDD